MALRDDPGSAPERRSPLRSALVGIVVSALGACLAAPDRPAKARPSPPPRPTAAPTREPEAQASHPNARYLISLDTWKTPASWFCFRNLKNPEDPSVCVQTEEECNLEKALKKKLSDESGVVFEGSACRRAEDPHCTFMYVREGRVAPTDSGKRAIWTASEKVNTCCNYICSETEAECEKQVAELRSVVLRESEREREQMSCDIPCRRWSTFPVDHDRSRPLECLRNHE